MAEMKTRPNNSSVRAFLNGIGNARRREDAFAVLELMTSVTRKKPRMWGPSIVGFDQCHYKYDSGREGDMCMIGFSPRSQALTLYVSTGVLRQAELLKRLGPHKTAVSCLYIKKLGDVDMEVLKELVSRSYHHMKAKYRGA